MREACRERYGLLRSEERLEAVRELGKLELPMGTPEELERELVPDQEAPATPCTRR